MRQQLISWLIDDIGPEVRSSRDPEGSILKFAQEKNLNQAQTEMLGHLFNTARTLAYMDKNASARGGSFPILDVPGMLKKFMQLPVKQAGMMDRVQIEFDDIDNSASDLPGLFAGITHNVLREEMTPQRFHDTFKQASVDKDQLQAKIALHQQQLFDLKEDQRKTAQEILDTFRKYSSYQFEDLFNDAGLIYEDQLDKALEKLATFCLNEQWPITIPDDLTPVDRVMRDPNQLLEKLANLQNLLNEQAELQASLQALTPPEPVKEPELLLKAGAGATALEEPTGKSEGTDSDKGESRSGNPGPKPQPKDTKPQGKPSEGKPYSDFPDRKPGPPKLDKAPKPSLPASLPERESLALPDLGAGAAIGKANELLDSVAGGIGRRLEPTAIKAIIDTVNRGQQKVDGAYQDARHMALLQDLMTTDEILAESDPDQIIGIYNTVRQHAPGLASDKNVMRVLLRSAVQHEGISPFDLNGLLETELNRQKVEMNQQTMNDSKYKGAPLKKVEGK